MKDSRVGVVMVVLGVAVATALSSCATSGTQQRDSVVSSMDDTKQYVERSKQQVDATIAAMNGLPRKSGEDLAYQYKQFVREYEKTQSLAQAAESRTGTLVSRHDQQVKAWREDTAKIQDPKLREQAEARRAEQIESFQPLVANMKETNTSFQVLMRDLKDIKNYLDRDLTPTGVETVKDVMTRAHGDAESVNHNLARLGQNLDQASAQMRP